MRNKIGWISKTLVLMGIMLALGCVQGGNQKGEDSADTEESLTEEAGSEKAISPEDAGIKGKFLEEDEEEPSE